MSDIARVQFGGHIETAGFGSVDQGLNSRRLDKYEKYNVTVEGDLHRFVPEKCQAQRAYLLLLLHGTHHTEIQSA